jgi:hemoglobin-like flavoprotein
MEELGQKLMTTLALAVAGLRNLEELIPALQMLGKRHVAYGVEEDHYPKVGRALLETLEIGLGDDFTEETKAAWSDAYGVA